MLGYGRSGWWIVASIEVEIVRCANRLTTFITEPEPIQKILTQLNCTTFW
jgi:hypothetical protein